MNDSQQRTVPGPDDLRRHPASGLVRDPRTGEIVLVDFLMVIVRNVRLIAAIAIVTATVFASAKLIRGPRYWAQSSFSPQEAGGQISSLAGIAAQFGFALPTSTGTGESLDFYIRLLTSPAILKEVATTTFRTPDEREPGGWREATLIELYKIKGATEAQRITAAVKRLEKEIAVEADLKARVIGVKTAARSRELSIAINRRLLDLVEEFNLEKRQTQARAEREFVEKQLQTARTELEEAEEAVRIFLERNREYRNSPYLQGEAARLQRRIDLRQQVYISLAKAYEEARIGEVRNTPVITVIDQPEDMVQRKRGLVQGTIFGLFFGSALALALAFAREYVDRQRSAATREYEKIQELRRIALAQLVPARLSASARVHRKKPQPHGGGAGDP